MQSSQNSQNPNRPVISYIPARLTEGKEWFVSYYVIHPFSGQLKRKKIKINRIKSITERRKIARKLIIDVNLKLDKGWNPFIEEAAPKGYHHFWEVFDTYFKVQEKTLEARTLKSYGSYVKYLKEKLLALGFGADMYVYQFDKNVATEIMLDIRRNPKLAPRTFNNYLIFYKSLFNWLKSYNYVNSNPFDLIKKLEKRNKNKRELFTPAMRAQLKEYLDRENPRYFIACLLCYYCFLRPIEISWLRVCDINFKTQTIRVRGEHAKNDNDSFRTIPDVMMPYLLDMDWSIPGDYYLFSGDKKGRFFSGKEHLEPIYIAKYWIKIREHFKWSNQVQFYNLKHTGITNMLADGVAPNFVQGQADHHSLEMTTIYAATQTPQSQADIRKKASAF